MRVECRASLFDVSNSGAPWLIPKDLVTDTSGLATGRREEWDRERQKAETCLWTPQLEFWIVVLIVHDSKSVRERGVHSLVGAVAISYLCSVCDAREANNTLNTGRPMPCMLVLLCTIIKVLRWNLLHMLSSKMEQEDKLAQNR